MDMFTLWASYILLILKKIERFLNIKGKDKLFRIKFDKGVFRWNKVYDQTDLRLNFLNKEENSQKIRLYQKQKDVPFCCILLSTTLKNTSNLDFRGNMF